ncbi:MAG: type II toxin-antitoxin system HicA family toxin [Thermomicrobiales bacterium]
MARILERKGWRSISIRGSHHKYGKGPARVVIPLHGNRSLSPGLQRDLMKEAGLSEADR